MNEINPENAERSEAPESFQFADLQSVEWWVGQFTKTENCDPGGVLSIFGGPVPGSSLAAAWYGAACGMHTTDGKPAFSKIIHIIPPTSSLRDVGAEICEGVKKILAIQGLSEDQQQQAADACASRCYVATNGDRIICQLEEIPEGAAVAISCAERIRYADVEVNREGVVTAHTGLQLNFTSEEELVFPHLYRLLEDLLRLSAERKFSVVVLIEAFSPVICPIPEKILTAKQFALINTRRLEAGTNHLNHLLKAEQIRKNEGIQPAQTYIEQNILEEVDRAIAKAELFGRERLFSAAWQALTPHLKEIRKAASGTLLNAAQCAAAAGAANDALSLLEEAWSVGLDALEALNSAALVARQLNAGSFQQKIVDALIASFPEHPWALHRQYECLYDSGSFARAAVLARKLGNEYEAVWCELHCTANPNWDIFLDVGTNSGRSDEALLRATSRALELGDLQLANQFIARVSARVDKAAQISLLIEILSKGLATAEEADLTKADDTLNEIFRYVAEHPEATEARLDLVELFEESLPDMTAAILLCKRCLDTYSRWQMAVPADAIHLEDDPLNSAESWDSLDDVNSFMEAFYEEAKPSVIGVGNVPESFSDAVNVELLAHLGGLMRFAARKQDKKLMVEALHAICVVCRSLSNPDSDYVAGLHAMGALAHAGEVQDALNLSETMLLFWPAAQPQFETIRRTHGWAAMSDAYLRAQNPVSALLHVCLSFEAMAQAPAKQQLTLFRHKIRLAARIFRTLRLTGFGRGFLEVERQFVALFPAKKWEFRELAYLELTYDLAELTSETSIPVLETMMNRVNELLRDDTETEWEPIVSGAASIFTECQKRGVFVADESRNLLFSRLGRCTTRIQNLIRRHLLEQPQLADVEAALRDLQGAARYDDQGFQMNVLEGFLRRAISAACDREDGDLFLAATTLLSQPGVAAVRARGVRNASLKVKMPSMHSTAGSQSSQHLADYAAATHLSSVGNEIRFSEVSLWPLSAVRYMTSPEETFCLLAYDSSRHLCQFLIKRDKVEGPKRLPQTVWSAAKHSKWSRCFPDHYAWTHETNYGVVDERPSLQAVKSSLATLGIEIPADAKILTFVPEAELFGFPFVITQANGAYLGERTRCSSVPSLPWLGSVRQPNTRPTEKIEAWLGSPKSPFDVLKVRASLLPAIQDCGGIIHNTDTPESLGSADVSILLSHGGRSLARGFGGIPEDVGRFTSDNLADWLRRCQCVILFVCHAGRSDDRLHNQETFGLVARLLSRQVRLVIAPPWPLNTDIPEIWLPSFLSALKAGHSASIAADNAAQAVRTQSPHPCAWAAMQLFGDAEFRFTTAAKAQKNNHD